MGRSVIPYSQQIELTKERLGDFRRALPLPDQEVFDEIFRVAKRYLAAGVMASNPYTLETILLSNLIALRKDMEALQAETTHRLKSSIDSSKSN